MNCTHILLTDKHIRTKISKTMETRVSLDRTNKNVENQVERNEDGMFREATVKIVKNPNVFIFPDSNAMDDNVLLRL